MPLILHDDTRDQLKAIVSHPPQALIVSGPRGIGKTVVVETLTERLLGAPPAGHRYYRQVDAGDGIAAVRDLQGFMALRTVGSSTLVDRIAVIEQAEDLSLEAENALLKLLEEPPKGAMLILTTSQPHQLLPTIHSRSQRLVIAKPSREALQDHFIQLGHDAPQVTQAIQLGQGLPGTVNAILDNDADNLTSRAVEQARDVLRASRFERLAMVDMLAKQKAQTIETLHMICQMADGALRQLATTRPTDAEKRISNWQQILRVSDDAESRLRDNGQAKLILTDYILRLP